MAWPGWLRTAHQRQLGPSNHTATQHLISQEQSFLPTSDATQTNMRFGPPAHGGYPWRDSISSSMAARARFLHLPQNVRQNSWLQLQLAACICRWYGCYICLYYVCVVLVRYVYAICSFWRREDEGKWILQHRI